MPHTIPARTVRNLPPMTRHRTISTVFALCLLTLSGETMAANGTSTSRLYAPKQSGESNQRFFQRAAREIGQKAGPGGQLSGDQRSALGRLARGAGYNSIRSVVERGGVKGSASGNSYVAYYRSGWNAANLVQRGPTGSLRGNGRLAPSPGYHDPKLEGHVRAMLAASPTGKQALARMDAAGVTIRFQNGGGTYNHAGSKSVVVDRKMMNGQNKPLSWLAVSVAHEASHAFDDNRKQTPSTVSTVGGKFSDAKAAGRPISNALAKELVADRNNYVTKQVAGEARGMTTEVRVRRELEAKGINFQGLNTNLRDAYNKGHDRVYRAAGVTPPKD